jgi:methyl-accepting chemotaxis protein
MKNLSIMIKFLSIMGLFGVFALGVAYYSTGQMRHIDDAYTALMAGDVRATVVLGRAARNFEQARSGVGQLLIADTDTENAIAKKSLDDGEKNFSNDMDQAAGLLPQRASEIGVLKMQGLDVLDNQCANTIKLGLAANTPASVAASQQEYLNNCSPKFPVVSDAIRAEVDAITKDTDVENDGLTDVTNHTVMITYSAIIGGLLLVLGLGFAGIRTWVVQPIAALMRTMGRLAGGDYQARVDGTDRRDEIGGMSRAVQVFKDAGIEKQRVEAEAVAARQVAEEIKAKAAAAEAEAAAQLQAVVTSLATGLETLANGDLLFRLNTQFAPAYEKLRGDFNGAMQQLQQTMKAIASNTSGVRSGAHEITTASDDLAKRTEQQAASLEQTAAALDEITATVRKTAEGATEARTVVSSAKEDAERSGAVVGETVAAMSGIETSSKQIGNIIGVIDEIAFQTNLLALNAGVEAARAGDAGRGFAVVATEVRALAQRSADAAKEIKTLISSSGRQVEAGVKLVGETGKALGRIVAQVNQLNALVTDIAASAQEQATALAEVNTAVNQMDQVTQQNAAMVEQSTAASHSLAGEAAELARLVGQFNLGEGTTAAAPSHRPAAPAPKKSRIPVHAPINKPAAPAPVAAGGEDWDEF